VNRLHELLARIDRATLRERVLLLAAAALVLAMAWQRLIMVPLDARRARLEMQLNEQRAPAADGTAPADDLAIDFANRMARETALRAELTAADNDLMDARRGMIAPNEMIQVLTTVLKQHIGLSLVLIRNLPAEPLLPPLTADAGAPDSAPAAPVRPAAAASSGDAADHDGGPYVHPVELVLQGDYLDVLAYLQALEAQSSGFLWRRFEYAGGAEAPQYRIEFATVSMDSNWLAV
jgi:MSHA biogenesis protein MshJ